MKPGIILLFITLIIGCSSRHEKRTDPPKKADIHSNKRKVLLNKKVHIVDTLPQLNELYKEISREKSKSYTLVSMYIASCTPCLVKMKNWKELILTDSAFSEDLRFIFYAKGDITWYFEHQVNEVNEFPFLIYHDPNDVFPRANNLPELAYVETILLDSMNTIVYSGNPMENEADFQELKSYLLDEKSKEK